MKKTILVAFAALLVSAAFAEDTIRKPKLMLRPYVENGVDFIRNEELQTFYRTKSKYFIGIGLQFGHPMRSTVIPFAQITHSKFTVDQPTYHYQTENGVDYMPEPSSYGTYSITTTQCSGGLLFPFKISTNTNLRARAAYSFAMIEDSYVAQLDHNTDKEYEASHGFQIGFGAERMIAVSRVYADILYNFQKSNSMAFSDYDMVKLAFGFVL